MLDAEAKAGVFVPAYVVFLRPDALLACEMPISAILQLGPRDVLVPSHRARGPTEDAHGASHMWDFCFWVGLLAWVAARCPRVGKNHKCGYGRGLEYFVNAS